MAASRATFDYELKETLEVGLVLIGSEVRALREGPANLTEAWVELDSVLNPFPVVFDQIHSHALSGLTLFEF